MTKVQNGAVKDRLQSLVKGNYAELPSDTVDMIASVFNINDDIFSANNIVKYATATTPGSTTIYSIPTKGKFYLTNMSMSYGCLSTDDVKFFQVKGFVGGKATILGTIQLTPGAAASNNTAGFPVRPTLLDNGTNITIELDSGGTNAGDAYVTIYGIQLTAE